MYILINKTDLTQSKIYKSKVTLCKDIDIHVNTIKKDLYINKLYIVIKTDPIKNNKRLNIHRY